MFKFLYVLAYISQFLSTFIIYFIDIKKCKMVLIAIKNVL